jgi:hypothetical protein
MDDWYEITGTIIGALVFVAVWAFCTLTYGFWGFVAGWLPSLVLYRILVLWWGIVILAGVFLGFFGWAAYVIMNRVA